MPSVTTFLDQAWSPTWDWPDTAIYVGAAVLLAAILRWLVNRVIDRVVRDARQRSERRDASVSGRAGRVLAEAAGYTHERHVQRTATMGSLLRSISTVVIFVLALLYVMDALGLNLAPILASAGVGGVALGFGAQSLVKDFLSGVFMIMEDQYGVGDVIDTGAVVGTVEEVTLRVTRIRDGQGIVWYVRNGEIVRVANRSQGWSTAEVDLPVSSSEDPERVIRVLRESMAQMDADPQFADSLLEAPSIVGIESVAGGTMTIRVSARCAANESGAVQRNVRERALVAFQTNGIKAPPMASYLPPPVH